MPCTLYISVLNNTQYSLTLNRLQLLNFLVVLLHRSSSVSQHYFSRRTKVFIKNSKRLVTREKSELPDSSLETFLRTSLVPEVRTDVFHGRKEVGSPFLTPFEDESDHLWPSKRYLLCALGRRFTFPNDTTRREIIWTNPWNSETPGKKSVFVYLSLS